MAVNLAYSAAAEADPTTQNRPRRLKEFDDVTLPAGQRRALHGVRRRVRSGSIAEHRDWMMRNFALTLAAVTRAITFR